MKLFEDSPKRYETAAAREPEVAHHFSASQSVSLKGTFLCSLTLTGGKRLREKACANVHVFKPNNEFAGPLLRGDREIK